MKVGLKIIFKISSLTKGYKNTSVYYRTPNTITELQEKYTWNKTTNILKHNFDIGMQIDRFLVFFSLPFRIQYYSICTQTVETLRRFLVIHAERVSELLTLCSPSGRGVNVKKREGELLKEIHSTLKLNCSKKSMKKVSFLSTKWILKMQLNYSLSFCFCVAFFLPFMDFAVN